MKKFCLLAALILCILPALALAEEDFELQDKMVLSGMDRSWYQGYEPVVSGDNLTIHLPVKSKTSDGKLTAELIMDDPAISPIKTEKLSAVFWRSEGLFTVKLSFRLSASRINGDYSARVALTGKNKEGDEISAEYPVVIRIRDGRDPDDALPQIRLDEAGLNVGEAGEISLTVKNAGRYADMKNLMLTVTDDSGDILPAVSDITLLPDLAAGESARAGCPVLVRPDADVALHTVRIKLSYTSAGKAHTWEERFTLPVAQTIRLEQGGVQLASTVIQGDMVTLTLPLMNMGRGELRNVMATLILPGVTDGQSVLAGVIAPGETKQAKISFTPGKSVLGYLEGEVQVSCEDAWGNPEDFAVPVSITVEEPVPVAEPAASIAEEAQEKNPYILYILAGMCALLILLLIIQGALLRRKIHRLEEDRL